jgi:hypothetical protein
MIKNLTTIQGINNLQSQKYISTTSRHTMLTQDFISRDASLFSHKISISFLCSFLILYFVYKNILLQNYMLVNTKYDFYLLFFVVILIEKYVISFCSYAPFLFQPRPV